MTLKENIEAYCRERPQLWIHSDELQRHPFIDRQGSVVTPGTIGRKLRELETEKVLAVKHDGSRGSALYRWIPNSYRYKYIPYSERDTRCVDKMWNI